jgi:hypothetical protein
MSEGNSRFNEVRLRRLVVEDGDGTPKIVMTTTPDRAPVIALLNDEGEIRLQIVMLDGIEPKILLSDSQGRGRVQMTIDAQDNAGITIFHDNDRPWLFCSTDGYRHYVMCLFDREKELTPTWVAQLTPEG